jgi:hypothetical protein
MRMRSHEAFTAAYEGVGYIPMSQYGVYTILDGILRLETNLVGQLHIEICKVKLANSPVSIYRIDEFEAIILLIHEFVCLGQLRPTLYINAYEIELFSASI